MSLRKVQNIILGAGIAGLGAAYTLKSRNEESLIIEKDDTYAGLCGNFTINGFRFDRFVHFSFSDNNTVNRIFQVSSPEIYKHIPNPFNLYKNKWIKHPAQNNLFPLSSEEKKLIIDDFKKRKTITDQVPDNYEDWLRFQFGDYFAEHFPMVYTRKYWMCEAKELETRWIGNRLYQPSIKEVIEGSETPDTPITYYSKEMRYPKYGGYKQFLKVLADNQNIIFNEVVSNIDTTNKIIKTSSGKEFKYQHLYSSIPLPCLIDILTPTPPETVMSASKGLKCTCGYQISIGFKTDRIPPYLWWYIYDEDNLTARVYSPSLKSPDNVPYGCSSLQLEVYCQKGIYSDNELIKKTVQNLINRRIIFEEDILFVDIRFENFANVVFDHNIYNNRSVVREYLDSIGIKTIGRFGEWGYLWSDQSLLSGLNI
jgi:protoporphyrinogen oxidase